MWRSIVAVTVCTALAFPAQLTQQSRPTIQEQVNRIAAGSTVEVKTNTKQKLNGTLGAVTAEGFEVVTVNSGREARVKLAYSDVKDISPTSTPARHSHALRYILIGAGIIGVVLLIGGLTTGFSN
jgi:hypothetical protein